MKGVNFLEACEALRDGKCKEIENSIGSRYLMSNGILQYVGRDKDGIRITPEMLLGKWYLIGVKKKERIKRRRGWNNDGVVYPTKSFDWKSLVNKPRMKMTLEWEG